MTLPSEPPGSTPGLGDALLGGGVEAAGAPPAAQDSPSSGPVPLVLDAVRLVAIALPLTVVCLYLGLIWIIGILVPPAHANSQKTGRQALSMIRAMTPPR